MKMMQKIRKAVTEANLLCLMLLALPQASHAATVTSVIKNVVNYLNGPLAAGAGVLAIVVVGYMTLSQQRLARSTFLSTMLGIGIILGGSQLYNLFAK